ncbi:MAG: membrane protein insertion efficiency factor YidD [Firmicutes bacterium]|nr:membrane protein insertion efficiency factor YidD [Bacillota bacterium]
MIRLGGKVARGAVLSMIQCYRRAVSPILPPTCRFYPSCSKYAFDAVSRFGVLRGGLLAVVRLSRCHPWNPGGYDPVPGPSRVGDAAGEAEGTLVRSHEETTAGSYAPDPGMGG